MKELYSHVYVAFLGVDLWSSDWGHFISHWRPQWITWLALASWLASQNIEPFLLICVLFLQSCTELVVDLERFISKCWITVVKWRKDVFHAVMVMSSVDSSWSWNWITLSDIWGRSTGWASWFKQRQSSLFIGVKCDLGSCRCPLCSRSNRYLLTGDVFSD